MRNFEFCNPTEILFGKGMISEISNRISKNEKILLTYGGGSIKRNGVYDSVKSALKGYDIIEFGGIEPNPHFETLMKAVNIVKNEGVTFIIAVGGGSVNDGSKFIASAACLSPEVDPWDILLHKVNVEKAIPLACVITLPATGSEMNGNAVITKVEDHTKLAFYSPAVYPKFSVLDPTVTFSLPKKQIANGIIDTFVHVMEQYYGYAEDNSMISDRFSEGILKTLIEVGPKIYNAQEPDYDNMANYMWAATMGLNGLIACGVRECWASHTIGHELTALHGLDHGVSLAIVLPGVMKYTSSKRKAKLLQFAERVWNIDKNDEKAGELAIAKTNEFFSSLGVKTHLSDYNIGDDTIEKIVSRFKARNMASVSGLGDISVDDVTTILKSRL